MFNCTTPRYAEIYAPWLRDPGALLRLARYRHGERLLDLCGGTGAVTIAALLRPRNKGLPPPDVTLVDLNPRFSGPPHVKVVRAPAEEVDLHLPHGHYDLVVCRQAMAYLNPERTFAAVAKVLKPGGRFAFNTFQRPKRVGFKYRPYDGVPFYEAHFFLFGRVFHLQMRRKIKPGWDISVFRYHPEGVLRELLGRWFDVECHVSGRSLRWVCTKRGDS